MATDWINRTWYPEASTTNPYFSGTGASGQRTWTAQNQAFQDASNTEETPASTQDEQTAQEPTGPAYTYTGGGGGTSDYAIQYTQDKKQSSGASVLPSTTGWFYQAVSPQQAIGGESSLANYDGGAWWQTNPVEGKLGADLLDQLQEQFRRLMGSMATTGQGAGAGLIGDYSLPWYLRKEQAAWGSYA